MLVEGRVQKSPEGVVHLMATRILDRSAELDHLWSAHQSGLAQNTMPPGKGPGPYPRIIPAASYGAMIPPPLDLTPLPRHRHPRDVRILPKSRDFH